MLTWSKSGDDFRRVVLIDSDSVNPYGLELALQLSAGGLDVRVAAAADTVFGCESVDLPLRETRSPVTHRSKVAEFRSMMLVAWHVLRGAPVIVVWARSYQKLLLGLAAYAAPTARLIYVLHNPVVGRGGRNALSRFSERWITSRATACVVHGRRLISPARSGGARRVEAVPHLMYVNYWRANGRRANPASIPTLLLLGSIRPDKFDLKDVGPMVEHLSASVDGPTNLLVCVRPRAELPDGDVNVNIINRSQDLHLSEAQICDALASSNILLAPYANVTDSGTINLALTAGLDVAAFAGGVLREYLSESQLVEPGDWSGFGGVVRDRLKRGRAMTPDEVMDRANGICGEWLSLLSRL